MTDKKSESIQLRVAIIGAFAACIVATISLFQPIVARLADIFIVTKTSVPADIIITETESIFPNVPTLSLTPDMLTSTATSSTLGQPLSATAIVTNCPSPSSYAIEVKVLEPGMVITGPATVHPYEGGPEIATALGLNWTARWGINIPNGSSIQMPQEVTLSNGASYIPNGYVDIYADASRMEAAQQCWLVNNP